MKQFFLSFSLLITAATLLKAQSTQPKLIDSISNKTTGDYFKLTPKGSSVLLQQFTLGKP